MFAVLIIDIAFRGNNQLSLCRQGQLLHDEVVNACSGMDAERRIDVTSLIAACVIRTSLNRNC